MQKNYLFPSYCKIIGWYLLLPFLVISIPSLYFIITFRKLHDIEIPVKVFSIISEEGFFSFIYTDIVDEIGAVGLVLSLVLIAFSREKDEDEYVEKIRLYSLFQSFIISCGVFVFGVLFIHGINFMSFSLLTMFLLPISFIVIFNFRLVKFRKSCHE